jgi:hypothetical protein
MKTITKDCKVGIYDNCDYVARIYPDRIVVTSPYVKWAGNTGGYAERKERITDTRTLERVQAALADDAEDSAWGAIGRALDDEWLAQAGV